MIEVVDPQTIRQDKPISYEHTELMAAYQRISKEAEELNGFLEPMVLREKERRGVAIHAL